MEQSTIESEYHAHLILLLKKIKEDDQELEGEIFKQFGNFVDSVSA